ncbi:acetylcholinesterase [Magnaporthiopsis poae ATCC 64411]|uniref:Carboxylic ester hydrolase n=1 Tax=Magnaporthiopsis poae (strain ATCC 64411 / 73-15) TaxID=644358 RepID=A0A0C4E2L7_MAGP6|nr:acetylcholinesterase [Magnaporthiopsis poae ATCC 64411]
MALGGIIAVAGPPPRPRHGRRILILALIAGSVIALMGLIFSQVLQPEALSGPTVDLGYATYVGSRRESGVNVFQGMRYARPPLGDLRWRAPVEPEKERNPTRAKAFGPVCLSTGASYPNNDQDEDCLYVNVWAPADARPGSKLPVWLFIQGGGYTANSNANYNGEEVVRRSNMSIVFVNFNYRVGLFGFLASEKVKKDGDLNVGLLDQRFVMKWIQKHISKFGGDPDHVVISGVSAGAGSVAMQLAAYGGRDDGLFVGGIIESLFFPAQPYLSDLEWQFDRLTSRIGCDTAEDADRVACLRGKSTRELQLANVGSPFPGQPQSPLPLFYWTPCVDGDLIRHLPYTMFERREVIRVPLIIGTDTDEGSYFGANAASQQDMRSFLRANFPRLRDVDLDNIQDQYPLMDALPNHNPWFPSTSRAYGEGVFTCPTVNVLDNLASTFPSSSWLMKVADNQPLGPAVDIGPWAYRYNVLDDENVQAGLGVPHTFEIPAVFGPDSVWGAPKSYRTYNSGIVPIVMDYWISFVKTLSPNALKNPAAPVWHSWASGGWRNSSRGANGGGASSLSRSRLLIETSNTRMEDTPADEVRRCEFWRSLEPFTQQRM